MCKLTLRNSIQILPLPNKKQSCEDEHESFLSSIRKFQQTEWMTTAANFTSSINKSCKLLSNSFCFNSKGRKGKHLGAFRKTTWKKFSSTRINPRSIHIKKNFLPSLFRNVFHFLFQCEHNFNIKSYMLPS